MQGEGERPEGTSTGSQCHHARLRGGCRDGGRGGGVVREGADAIDALRPCRCVCLRVHYTIRGPHFYMLLLQTQKQVGGNPFE